MNGKTSFQKLVWPNILFFAVTTLGAVIGTPFYVYHYGISLFEILLTLFFVIATGLSITVGYHRLFAHVSFKAHPLVRFLLLLFGAAAFEQSALKWAAQHRDHHRYVDTDRDPYSIKKGFFYAHIGWLIFWDHVIPYDNAKDLQEDAMVVHQHRYYYLWAVGGGIVLPALLGALAGKLLGALLFAVCLRLTFVYHATFCINSVCHMFGQATYDPDSSARDHWFVAFLTFGEGYHNFHHRFPSDYRNGVRWYHWDPSKWFIRALAFLGLARDLKRISKFRILDARIAAEHTRVQRRLEQIPDPSIRSRLMEFVSQRYQKLRGALRHWEGVIREHQSELQRNMKYHSRSMQDAFRQQIKLAKLRFYAAYERWSRLVGGDFLTLAKV